MINGNAPKKVLIRAVGPALAGFGVAEQPWRSGLTVSDGTHTVVAMNDDWGTPLGAAASQTAASAADIVAAETSDERLPAGRGQHGFGGDRGPGPGPVQRGHLRQRQRLGRGADRGLRDRAVSRGPGRPQSVFRAERKGVTRAKSLQVYSTG